MIRPYFDRNEAGRIRSRRRRRSAAAAILAIVMLAGAVALGTAGARFAAGRGWFGLRRTVVTGCRLVPAADVERAAQRFLGRPFWTVDRQRLAAGLAQRHPAIKSVSVTVRPWWTLAVDVRERTAAARAESDPAMVVSPEGVIFRDSARADLPRLRIAGTSAEGRRRALTAVLTCPAAQPDWLFDPTDPGDIRLLAGGAIVHLGNGGFAGAWGKLAGIRRDLEQNGADAAEIDLRIRDQGIVVLREQPAAAN